MPRVAAWSCLRSGSGSPLRLVDRFARERGLDERDRALARRLVGVEVRHRATLRAIVQALVPRRPKPDLLAHLHLGIAQLLWFDRVPDHAAIQATGSAAGETNGLSKSAPVRELVQRIAAARQAGLSGDPRRDLVDADFHFETPLFPDPAEHEALWVEAVWNLPAPLFKRWSKRLGREQALALAEAFLREPLLAVRAVGVSREALQAELAAADLASVPGAHPRVLHLDPELAGALTSSAPFREGRATVQGDTAAAVAGRVAAGPGERVLDLCSAPGGKAAGLAEAGAHVVAADVSPARLVRALETWRRLGVRERVSALVCDGARGLGGTSFDAVLVDAPCSNTGVLGARPGARWRFGPASLSSLSELQERLLEEAAGFVRPGGRLVWSTCSLEPEENGRRVRAFLEQRPGWSLEEEVEALPLAEGSGPAPVDGGYSARLRRPDRG